VTRDHSVVGVQEDAGVLTEAEAMRHPRRNEILRDVGFRHHQPEDDGFVDLYDVPLAPGATLVLCSDGLTDYVPAGALHETILAHAGDPAGAARALVDRALAAGGRAHVTVVVVEAVGPAWQPVRALAGEV